MSSSPHPSAEWARHHWAVLHFRWAGSCEVLRGRTTRALEGGSPRPYKLGSPECLLMWVSPGWKAATGGPVGQPVGIPLGLCHFSEKHEGILLGLWVHQHCASRGAPGLLVRDPFVHVSLLFPPDSVAVRVGFFWHQLVSSLRRTERLRGPSCRETSSFL